MKFALCNEMYKDWSLENQFDAFAAWGYDGAELAPFSLDPDFISGASETTSLARITESLRRRVISCVRNSGVQVSGLHWILAHTSGFHITTGDADTRARTARRLSELAYLCAELGGSYMVLGSPAQRNVAAGQTKREASDNARDTISQVLPTLEKTGVVLALEALAPTETNFWVNADEVLDFIRSLGSPASLSLHLDCKAMDGGEYQSIPDTIKYYAPQKKLLTFHANDPNLQGPGFGRLNFVWIMEALKEINFDGWIGIEPFDYSPGVVELGRESIRYLKKCLQSDNMD